MRVIRGCSNPQSEEPRQLGNPLFRTLTQTACRSSPLVTHAPMIFRHQHSALQQALHAHSVGNWLELHFRLNLRHCHLSLPPLPLLLISLSSPDYTPSHGGHLKYLTLRLLDDDGNIDKARTAEFKCSETSLESVVGQLCHLSDNSSVLQMAHFNCFRPLLLIYPDVYDPLITISRHIFLYFCLLCVG